MIISAPVVLNKASSTLARNAMALNATSLTAHLMCAVVVHDVVEKSAMIVSKKMERLGKGQTEKHFVPLVALRHRQKKCSQEWARRRDEGCRGGEEIDKKGDTILHSVISNLEAKSWKPQVPIS